MQRRHKKEKTSGEAALTLKQPSTFSKVVTFCNEHKTLIFILFLVISGLVFFIPLPKKEKQTNPSGETITPETAAPKAAQVGLPLINSTAPVITKLNTKSISNVKGCEDFEVLGGDYEGATTFILGEPHNRHEETIKCMDGILKDKNIFKHSVFVEFVPLDDEFKCSEKDVPTKPGRTCIGWDNEKIMLKLYEYNISHNLYVKLRGEFASKNLSEEKFDTYLKQQLLKRFNELQKNIPSNQVTNPSLRNYSQLKFDNLFKIIEFRAMQKILDDRKKNKSYQEIFSAIRKEGTHIAGQPTAEYIADTVARNHELITVASRKEQGFKFILVGKAHVAKTGLFKEFDQGALNVQRALNQSSNSYALLASKHNK